jgi:hypothetical protein
MEAVGLGAGSKDVDGRANVTRILIGERTTPAGTGDPAILIEVQSPSNAGADFAKGSRFTDGGGSDDITPIRRLGNWGLNQTANLAFGTRFTDLCYGYNAFWADMIQVLDLPATDQPGREEEMIWGDGFEIETMINCRIAAADSTITEVPSMEFDRIHGDTNLNTIRDGFRVLYTIHTERVRHRATRRARRARRRTPAQTPNQALAPTLRSQRP